LKQNYILDRLNYIKKEGLKIILETETMHNGDGDGVDDGATNTNTNFNTTGELSGSLSLSLSSLLSCITIMTEQYCSKVLPSKEQNQLLKSSYIPNGLFDFQSNETTANTTATTGSENAYDNVIANNINNINNFINRFDTLRYKYYNSPGKDF
jgi:hypothetical protein